MGLFDGCLFTCDIDGTLLKNGVISRRNLEKIEYFINEGGYFSLSTGRSASAITDVLKILGNVSPSVVTNGCMIYDYKNDKILGEKLIFKEDYILAKKVIDLGLDIGVEIHAGKNIITLQENEESYDHRTSENFETQFLTYEDACKYNWNKVLYMFKDLETFQTVKRFLSKEPSNCEFVDTSAFVYGRKRIYHEQTPKAVSKASAVKELCNILNVKNGKHFAMGDYYNDLEMLKMADISAVPEETPDEIKAIADFIAGPCEDGAVADFIDYLTKCQSK